MKLGHVIVHTGDVLQTVAFYEQAFGLARRFVHDSRQYAEMDTGTTALAFVSDALVDAGLPLPWRRNLVGVMPAGIQVGLCTPVVEAAYERAVTHGATPVLPPTDRPWGQTVAYVLDNNGVLVELATPVSAGPGSAVSASF